MAFEFLAAFLHFQQKERPPEEVGEAGGLALVDAVFEIAACLEDARVAERLEEAFTEDLRLALFIAGQVLTDESDELADFDDGVVHENALPHCNRRTAKEALAADGCHYIVIGAMDNGVRMCLAP